MGIIEKVPYEKIPGGKIVLTSIDYVLNWGRRTSIWYLTFGLACCAIEMMATGASRFDFDRFGIFHRPSPRQVDLMIVAGTVTYKMASRVKLLYQQMPEPKYVIAMGNCAISGGIFSSSYSVLKGADLIIPVDVYIPGCPPAPEVLLDGVIKLQDKIKGESVKGAHWK
jgi:NADH-quinone oxidoreductase subunit B